MNESMNKMAYLAVRQSYPKGRYKIVKKSYYKPSGQIDWKILELINPVPSFASQFLVIDESATDPTKKVTNVWVKFCSTGQEVGPKKFDGMVSFTKKELRNILDDKQLHSNVMSKSGEHHKSTLSSVIFVASHRGGDRVYISKPIYSLNLVKSADGFHDASFKKQFRDDIKAGDPRKIEAGRLIHEAKAWEEEGITTYDSSGGDIKIWWRIENRNPKEVYPYSFTRDEYKALLDKINPDIFNTTVGVCAHASIPDYKRLCFVKLSMDDIEKVYNAYLEEGKAHHAGLKGKELTVAQVNWIKRKFPEYPLFPVYHWAFNNKPLYYECLQRIN
jgi:hypothetical protein